MAGVDRFISDYLLLFELTIETTHLHRVYKIKIPYEALPPSA
ncbi:hypothetical protein M7I_1283 [Glarea lozoyensis 74030]|uniref:Uncharacterized protein n=1 Tax=Glarea lozoyensis (strain ATCC 74030 / MF5533) TaxID=1104152 RepID=H0EFK7_GLAL7|nr:hypothetical protein M7I_1283 [Glarea lozoyensis 74030]